MNKQVNLKIKKARKRKDMTQEQAAIAIGIPRTVYLKIENGDRDVKVSLARKFSEFYEKTMDELFG